MAAEAPVVRFGIVGLGMGANRARLAATTPGATLTCVCALEAEQARVVAEKHGCAWTTDYEAMLRRDDVDVVGVMAPSGLHAELAMAAVRAGKHVFTTKPMDIRLEACDALIREAEQRGAILAVDFGSRYEDVNHRIRMALRAGHLGQIFLGDVRLKWFRAQSYYDGGSPPGWRSRRATEGGSLANQGIHFVDLLQWFLGPVRRVEGRIATFAHAIETEDAAQAFLTFESGAWGLIETTTACLPDLGTRIEIHGDGGTLLWKNGEVELWHSRDHTDAGLEAFTPDPNRPRNIIQDMVSAVTLGTAVAVDGREARKSVAILDAIYESARIGRPVELIPL